MYFHVSSITNVFLHRSNKVKKQEKKNRLIGGMMFGMPVRCYQSWVAAHLSTPRLLQSLGFSQQDINVNLKGKRTEEAETGRESKKKKKKSFYFVIRGITET